MKNRYRKPENISFRARVFIDMATWATFFVEREALNKDSAIVHKGKSENLRMKISAPGEEICLLNARLNK